jgi:hypothetical protein
VFSNADDLANTGAALVCGANDLAIPTVGIVNVPFIGEAGNHRRHRQRGVWRCPRRVADMIAAACGLRLATTA